MRQPDFPQRGNESANGCIGPENPEFHHSYAIWLTYDFAPLDETKKNEKKAWRVSEFLGVTRRLSKEPSSAWGKVKDDVADASLVVLDDADLGFRNNRDLWPASVRESGGHPWISYSRRDNTDGRVNVSMSCLSEEFLFYWPRVAHRPSGTLSLRFENVAAAPLHSPRTAFPEDGHGD